MEYVYTDEDGHDVYIDTFIDDDGEECQVKIIEGDEEDLMDILVDIAQQHYLPRYL